MAEPSDLLILVQDIAVHFHFPHDLQFPVVPEHLVAGDGCGGGQGILFQLECLDGWLI